MADWMYITAYAVLAAFVATPLGRLVGIWLGSDDPKAGFWRRHYGRPGRGMFLGMAGGWGLQAVSALSSGMPVAAAVFALMAPLAIACWVGSVRKGWREFRVS